MFAWVCEEELPNGNLAARYLGPSGITVDPCAAIRFARKEDAKGMIALLTGPSLYRWTIKFRAVEHGWED